MSRGPSEAVASNRELVVRFHDEVINGQDFDLALQILHPAFEHRRGAIGYTMQQIAPRKVAALRNLQAGERFVAATRLLRSLFPEWQSTLDDVIAGDDKVVTLCTVRGRDRGGFLKTGPAGGAAFELQQVIVHTLEEGRIKSVYALCDELGLWRALGARLPA